MKKRCCIQTKQVFTAEQLYYLHLLSKQYPTVQAAGSEIVKLHIVGDIFDRMLVADTDERQELQTRVEDLLRLL